LFNTVIPTSQTSGTKPTPTKSDTAFKQLGNDYTQFIRLLTAQIKNQDPLKPMDSTQFVTQLAQLSQVEQTVSTNKHLEGIQTKMNAFATLAGANIVGRQISLVSNVMELKNGSSQSIYQLEATAKSVTATISNEAGKIINVITGLQVKGGTKQVFDWNGLDQNGQKLQDGNYTLALKAVAGDGSKIAATIYQSVKVKELLLDKGQQYLALSNGTNVSLLDVLSLR